MEAATERKAAVDARLAKQAACVQALAQLEAECLVQHEALETVQA